MDSSDKVLLTKSGINGKQIIQVPENTFRIKFTGGYGGYTHARLSEVAVYNQPEIKSYVYYPTLTEYGVEYGYNEVVIDYFVTSVKKQYRINKGNWQEYQNNVIRLEIGDKLDARGIDKNGNETKISTYTAVLPSDALGPEAYDGNISTTVENGYLNISKELWNKKISIVDIESQYSYKIGIEFLDSSDKVLLTKSGINRKQIIEVPENTFRIKFTGGYGGDTHARLSEVMVVISPAIFERNYYSTVTQNEIIQSYNEIKITYLSYLPKKLYSLDNGTTWLDYTKPFKADIGTKILAKAIDKDGNETEVVTYTVKVLTDNMPNEVFDNSKETSSVISKNSNKLFGLNGVDNNTLRIYTTGEVASNSYIKLFDSSNQELASVSLTQNLTTLVIPIGSVKASVYSGSSTLTITEINLRTNAIKDSSPSIEINDVNWSVNKTIDITYPEGYRNEYSLDLGETWIEYLSPITVENETTVLARVVDNGKVVSSSSFTITKIDTTEPTIELNLPDRLVQNLDLQLPTKYTFGISGATVVCKDAENVVISTKNLELGSHEIVCNIESGAGISKTVSKNIIIVESDDEYISNYNYTGDEQIYTIGKTGFYQLETWGAQGGSVSSYIGGYGGYSSGIISLNEGDKLYINIGGQGSGATYIGQSLSGGYNGGGNVIGNSGANHMNGSGGGATHIATSSGLLSNLEKKESNILIVSGGGGGARDQANHVSAARWGNGGSGGGMNGVGPSSSFGSTTSFTVVSSLAGTQSSGNAFGIGESIFGNSAGGGGYYGGFSGGNNHSDYAGAGGGGSGYIGNSLLTNKVMYCYSCSESSEESTKTISTTNVSEEAISYYAKIGNGYARITYIGE